MERKIKRSVICKSLFSQAPMCLIHYFLRHVLNTTDSDIRELSGSQESAFQQDLKMLLKAIVFKPVLRNAAPSQVPLLLTP